MRFNSFEELLRYRAARELQGLNLDRRGGQGRAVGPHFGGRVEVGDNDSAAHFLVCPHELGGVAPPVETDPGVKVVDAYRLIDIEVVSPDFIPVVCYPLLYLFRCGGIATAANDLEWSACQLLFGSEPVAAVSPEGGAVNGHNGCAC